MLTPGHYSEKTTASSLLSFLYPAQESVVFFINLIKQQDMAYWMTSTQIATKYEVTEQEIISWTKLKEISSAYINGTLMIDDDSVQFYLGTNKMLAEKQAIRARLLKEEDRIIKQELEKYDEAALLIRLQSECFPLYDLLIKVLAAMIPNTQDRKLFCAITQGYSLRHIPKYHNMSDKDAL